MWVNKHGIGEARAIVFWILIFTLGICPFVNVKGQATVEAAIKFDQELQTFEGFGASIIGWRSDMASLYQDLDFIDFVVHDLGLSIFRMQIWPDVSTRPIDLIEDIRHEDFEWKGRGNRGRINMDFARRILEINPEIKIIGSIWSPPAWMKESGKIDGTRPGFLLDPRRDFDHDNRLRDDRYGHYAKWIYEWVEYMHHEGIPLYALGPQNELMFTEPYESCMYTPEEFARLVRMIGEQFEMEGRQRPIIYGPEDMTLACYDPDNPQGRHTPYVDALMDEKVAPYFDVFATHGYTDGVREGGSLDPKRYWESIRHFNRPYWITEGGTGGHEWPTPIEQGIGSFIHHALADGQVSAFVCWQITDVEPNTHGVMVKRMPTKKTYAAMHYWRFIRPGFVRVSADTHTPSLRMTAYKDPGTGHLVAVLINDDEETQQVRIRMDHKQSIVCHPFTTSAELDFKKGPTLRSEGGFLAVDIPGKSIMTLVEVE